LFNYVIYDTFTLCRACKSGTEIPSHKSEKLNDPVCSLSIKGPVGDLYQLELPGSQFEGIEIKRKIYELIGIPISMQTLSSGSKCIHNTSVLMCRRRTIEVSVKALGGGLTNPCQSCGVREAEYSCSECHGMTYCAVCNDTWHVNNPIRQGHPYVEICRDTTGEVQKNTYIEPDSGVQLSPSPHSVSKSSLDLSLLDDEFFDGILGSSSQDLEESCRRATLAEYFHCTSFRPYQIDVIDQHLKGRDTIVVQPTGSGKSLCFQFPAVYTGKMSVVICFNDSTYTICSEASCEGDQ